MIFTIRKAFAMRAADIRPTVFISIPMTTMRSGELLLDPLSPGGSGEYAAKRFDLENDRPFEPDPQRAKPTAALIVDGIFLHRPELRSCWDLSIFLKVDFEVSLPRGAARGQDFDAIDPNSPPHRRYVGGQKRYLAECTPEQQADIVIDYNDHAGTPKSIDAWNRYATGYDSALPPFPLPPFRDKGHERGERRRRLAAARVIQKRSRKRRAPVVEHADQRAGLDAVANVTLERQPEANAVMDGTQREAEIGRDKLCRRRNLHDTARLLELPIQQRPAAEAGADAGVIEQILRMFRPAMLRNIFARRHHRVALRRAERDSDHVLRQMLAIAHAGVKACRRRCRQMSSRRRSPDRSWDGPRETARPSAPAPDRSPAAAH